MNSLNPRDIRSELYGASCCPVCLKPPKVTVDPAVHPTATKSQDTILRCPLDHPYVAIGDNLTDAVKHWNIYVEFRMRQSNQMRATPVTDTILSHCKNCLALTRTILTITEDQYIEECAGCHLTKAVKEAE